VPFLALVIGLAISINFVDTPLAIHPDVIMLLQER
jgi:hypothetical protein